VSYLLQIRAIEREVLAASVQAPFLEEGSSLPSVAEVIAEFDGWLTSEDPAGQPVAGLDVHMQQQYRAMGVRGGSR
jgi:hypothetical protein